MAIPNVIELCAGYGGIGLGLTLALGEIRVRVYVEREISVARKLVARFQDGTLAPSDIWSNLKTFDGRPYKGKIDILCAGYPCQPFSCAGKQMGHKDPRHLWPHVARIADECQPRQIFLENVDAHLRLGFFEVARELSAMGYRIAAGLFSAEETGAPHRRLRLFALAGGRAQPEAHAAVARRSGTLADSRTRRSSQRSNRQDSEEERAALVRSSLPLFPPGPADLEAWSRLLMQCPFLEPAVCQFANGRTDRVSQLRALGNGVVPLVAAHAYRTLTDALQAAD